MTEEALPDVEEYLLRAREAIEQARPMPLSASALVNKEDLLVLVDDSIAALPEELKRARWLLKERDEILAEARREADQIIMAARTEAGRRVERTEIVRESARVADQIRADAEAASRQMRHEAEDYVDQKLASFEVVLDRTMQAVQKGREKLNLVPEPEVDVDLTKAESEFFDQDQNQADQLA